MKLQNNFSEKDREAWTWEYHCFCCGMNGWDCLHHILGRTSSSILNSVPLHNDRCHIGNGRLATFKVQTLLLKKTFDFLTKVGHSFSDEDKKFIKKNIKHYATFITATHLKRILE